MISTALLTLCALVASEPRSLEVLSTAAGLSIEAGAVAPANRWTTSAGCAAGTGRASTTPLRGPVEEAWAVELAGELVGEPLVWDERVLVEVSAGGDRRELHTLELATGERAARPHVLRSDRALAPSLWGNLIAVRRGGDTLEVLRWGRSELSRYWTYRSSSRLAPPLLFGAELYIATAQGLERLRVGDRRPVWRVEGEFRGRPALRGDSVFALQYDARGAAFVTEVDRRTGELRGEVGIGPHEGRRDGDPDDRQLAVHARGVYAWSAEPFRVPGPGAMQCVGIPRPLPSRGRFELLAGTGAFETPPAEAGAGWVAYFHDDERGRLLAHSVDARDAELLVLASAEDHREFIAGDAPWTVAGGVALQGRSGVELESGRVLWQLGGASSERAVPARETVLVRDGARRLIALREQGGRDERALLLTGADAELPRGRALLRDGRVELANFRLDANEGALVAERAGREERHALADVLLLEDRDGALAFTAGEEPYGRALAQLVELGEAEAYARLAEASRGTNDVALMSRLASEAAVRGADDAALLRVRKRIEELTGRNNTGKEPRVSVARVRELERQEQALGGLGAELYWERFEALPAATPLRYRTRLLRAVLSRGPHTGAGDAVRALLPADVRPPEDFDALDWVDFVEAVAVCPLELVAMPAGPRASQSSSERALARAARGWRPDLVGFQSEHLLIVTPLARPGAIARCLSMGELVCDALADLFASDGAIRDPERRLVLHLFESKEEYLAQSGARSGEAGIGLEWTSGHYDFADNVSRIFLPEGDDGFDSVMRTYAHELTHHWLRLQCPRFDAQGVVRADLSGYWIVEGFACLIEDFRFDLARRSYETFDPRSPRLDNVANARSEQLFPWGPMFELTQQQLHTAGLLGSTPIASSWILGRRQRITPRHAYYSQAAATCQYLFHAEGGARRDALFDYLAAFYTGDDTAIDVEPAFGFDVDELGARVREYAKGVMSGRRP